MENVKRGLFLSVEGLNPELRANVVELLEKKFMENNKKILKTSEYGDLERELLPKTTSEDLSDKSKLFLVLVRRRELLESCILPYLKEYDYVLVNSYSHSTFAHMGYGKEGNVDDIYTLNAYMTENIFPDVTFYIDTLDYNPLSNDSKMKDSIDFRVKQEYYRKVRNGYLDMANDKRYGHMVVVESGKSEDEIVDHIMNYVRTVELAKKLKMMASRDFNDDIDEALKNISQGNIIDISHAYKKR